MPRLRTFSFLLTAALMVALLGGVGTAHAAFVTPTAAQLKWPGRTISYWDASREPIAVARAVAAWNRSGIAIRFVRAPSARAARLIIRNTRDVPNGCGTGKATVGYVAPPGKAYVHILSDPTPDRQACAWPGQTLLVAHELGHVLGFGHVEQGCRLMNPTITQGIEPMGCTAGNEEDDYIARSGTWRCRILEPADVRMAVRRYGGVVRPVRANPMCNLVPRIAAPTVAATWDPAALRVQLTVHRPVAPTIPPYLRARADRTERFELYRAQGTCVTTPPADAENAFSGLIRMETWRTTPGTDQFDGDPGVGPGTWCYSAWAVDAFGKYGAGPGTATVVVPEQPPATS